MAKAQLHFVWGDGLRSGRGLRWHILLLFQGLMVKEEPEASAKCRIPQHRQAHSTCESSPYQPPRKAPALSIRS